MEFEDFIDRKEKMCEYFAEISEPFQQCRSCVMGDMFIRNNAHVSNTELCIIACHDEPKKAIEILEKWEEEQRDGI